ncbi:dihydrolipoamide acetyltransferase family protein [Vibrio alfacsensis]|uniref:dihydrolipoamide acetyltransferase family protein n=1 Tax=Vibrio alfacsensis TaxID=1074311 RepID=UPI004067E740
MDNHAPSPSLIDITMPALGADMRDGTLLEWLIKPGDNIEKGDIIAVIETSKGAIDMESYHNGTISELLVEPEIKLPVGSVMARMESNSPTSEALDESALTSPIQATDKVSDSPFTYEEPAHEALPIQDRASNTTNNTLNSQEIEPDETPFPPYIPPRKLRATHSNLDGQVPTTNEQERSRPEPEPHQKQKQKQRVFASPVVRKTAFRLGIDLSSLTGSGPKGAIVLRDLLSHLDSNEAKSLRKTETKNAASAASTMRQAISDAMTRSKQEIPHYYLAQEINLTHAQKWLTQQNQQREPEQRLLLPALLLTAIARQLVRFPQLNGFYHGGCFTPSTNINIANTISLREGGLVTPAILNADQLSIQQVMDSLRDITERGRHGRLRSSEISQGSITVTSIGERGADMLTGVIYPPQVAIIGLGRLRKAPIINNHKLEIGEVMTVTLAADHRVSDGISGARFLHALAKQLQHPEAL